MSGKKKSTRKRSSRRRTRSRRPLPGQAILILAVLATALCLLVVLRLPPHKGQVGDSSLRADGSSGKGKELRQEQGGSKGDRVYEERLPGLAHRVETADMAIVQSLAAAGVEPDRLLHREVEQRGHESERYHYQELELQVSRKKGEKAIERLDRLLGSWLPHGSLEREPGSPPVWRVRLNGVLSHRILLRPPEKKRARPPSRKERPRLALVIDDMGNSLSRAREILDLFESAVALSILPKSRYAEEIAREARSRGADVMLHLPMEPRSYPDTDPGPGSLFTRMDGEQIRTTLESDLREVPGVVGVNNHMGSELTTEARPMREVLLALDRRGLFFMDSLTHPESVADQLASRLGVKSVKRDIFLDNDKNVESIRFQLRKAEHLARQQGQAVAIGHPYPQTVQALRQWMAERDGDIRLCRLSSLVGSRSKAKTEKGELHGGTDLGHRQTGRD